MTVKKKRLSMVPFIFTAIHSWIEENGETPFVLVDLSVPGIEIPGHLRKEATVVLNLSSTAIRHLYVGQEGVQFNTRFNGADYRVVLPMRSVISVLSRESGEGMNLPHDKIETTEAVESMERTGATIAKSEEPVSMAPTGNKRVDTDPAPKGKNHLRVIK